MRLTHFVRGAEIKIKTSIKYSQLICYLNARNPKPFSGLERAEIKCHQKSKGNTYSSRIIKRAYFEALRLAHFLLFDQNASKSSWNKIKQDECKSSKMSRIHCHHFYFPQPLSPCRKKEATKKH